MSLYDFQSYFKNYIDTLTVSELEEYINNLEYANYKRTQFLPAVLTRNTIPIKQSIDFNNVLIDYSKRVLLEKLKNNME